jgi:hypothetical protein
MFKKQSHPVLALSLLTAFALLPGCKGKDQYAEYSDASQALYAETKAAANQEAPAAVESANEAATEATEEKAPELKAEVKEDLPSDLFQLRELEVGKAAMDVFIDGPRGANSQRSGVLAFVSCDENPIRGAYSGVNGITVLPGSRVALKRDRSYQFGDGSNASDITPNSAYTCNGDRSLRDTAWFEGNPTFRNHRMSVGMQHFDMLLASPNGAGEPTIRPVVFKCEEGLHASAFNTMNGVTLARGSQIIVARKPGKGFIGYSSDDTNAKFSVISCE